MEYIGMQKEDTLSKGNYIISFEYTPQQVTSAVLTEYIAKICSNPLGWLDAASGPTFEDRFNLKTADLIQNCIQKLKESHCIVNNYSINKTTYEKDGYKYVFPRVINFDITVTENPIPFFALALLVVAVLVVIFPEPFRVAIKKVGGAITDTLGDIAKKIPGGLVEGMFPLFILVGIVFLGYTFMKKGS